MLEKRRRERERVQQALEERLFSLKKFRLCNRFLPPRISNFQLNLASFALQEKRESKQLIAVHLISQGEIGAKRSVTNIFEIRPLNGKSQVKHWRIPFQVEARGGQ